MIWISLCATLNCIISVDTFNRSPSIYLNKLSFLLNRFHLIIIGTLFQFEYNSLKRFFSVSVLVDEYQRWHDSWNQTLSRIYEVFLKPKPNETTRLMTSQVNEWMEIKTQFMNYSSVELKYGQYQLCAPSLSHKFNPLLDYFDHSVNKKMGLFSSMISSV